jgi:hypothetical protein
MVCVWWSDAVGGCCVAQGWKWRGGRVVARWVLSSSGS